MNTSKEYELSILRTKLSNQRTYLLYIQAGFVLASIAGMFKKKNVNNVRYHHYNF